MFILPTMTHVHSYNTYRVVQKSKPLPKLSKNRIKACQ